MKKRIRQHEFTCDRCGRTGTTDDQHDGYSTQPDGWKNLGTIDICNVCRDDFNIFMDGQSLLRWARDHR